MSLTLLSFLFLAKGIGTVDHHILYIFSPRTNVPDSGGECFICRGSE